MKRAGLAIVVLALASAGCDSERTAQQAAGEGAPARPAASSPAALSTAAPAQTRPTLTSEQRAVYDRTCATCHGQPGTGAPPAGDTEAWAPRVAQGLPTLLDHTVNGYGGMPPMGLCMECDQEQLIAFIEYMAGVECDEGV